MVRNQLTPKCNRSNRCSFTKTRPEAGFPSVINCWILCQYGMWSLENIMPSQKTIYDPKLFGFLNPTPKMNEF